MKKKIIAAVVAMVLIVALTCSLAACSSSMFDGSYKKEASNEQAQSAWTSARVAFGASSSTMALASSNSNELVKGWTGIKFTYNREQTAYSIEDGEKSEFSLKAKSDGAFLFDESATSVTGSYSLKTTEGKDKEELSYSAGIYAKDNVLYNDVTVNDASLKIKFPEDTGILGAITNSTIKAALSKVTSNFISAAYASVYTFVCDMSYDSFIAEYAGVKAYVNDSGNYVRVKYVLTAEVADEMFGSSAFEGVFADIATLGDCSLIIVTDKEDGSFQGAKLSFNFDCKKTADGEENSLSLKFSTSIENCSKITNFPSNFNDYKDVSEVNADEVLDLLKAI